MKRCTRNQEGTWPGQLTWTRQSNIQYQRASCPVYKFGGVRQEGPITAGWCTGYQSVGEQCYFSSLVSLFSVCYFHFHFPFIIIIIVIIINQSSPSFLNLICFNYLTVISTHGFYLFRILLTIPLGREWVSCSMVLSYQLGLNHSRVS